MGKYVLYGIVTFMILFTLNFFNVIHVPMLDVSDQFLTHKTEVVSKTTSALKGFDG